MKLPTWLLTILLVLGGGVIGLIIAFNTFPEPNWNKLVIPSNQSDATNILFVDHIDAEKVENDIVYIKTKSGEVYSAQHNEWTILTALPNKETISRIGFNTGDTNRLIVATSDSGKFYELKDNSWKPINTYKEFHWTNEFDQCATTKEWRHTPPVEDGVVDSKGVVFEHTISGFIKCYVLYKDGHLEAWSYAGSGLYIVWTAPFYSAIGAISGGVLSFIVWLFRRNRNMNKELL